MKRTYYRIWCPAQGQHQENGCLILAPSADFAATKWADQTGLVPIGGSVTVRVREEPDGQTRAFLVSCEADLRGQALVLINAKTRLSECRLALDVVRNIQERGE